MNTVTLLGSINKNAERWMLLTLYAVIVSSIFMEVLRRFVLSYSSIWGEEAARYCFIYLVWIGAAAAVRDGSHIRIDVLTKYLSNRVRGALLILGDFCTLVLACFALVWSLSPVLSSLEFESVSHGLRVNQAWFLAAVPFGFLLVAFRVIQSVLKHALVFKSGGQFEEAGGLFQ